MPRTPAVNLPPAVLWLSAGLGGIHIVRQLLGPEADSWVLLAFAFIPARYGELGDLLPGGAGARLWSPLTYSVLHADFVHLLVNVVWMASFGAALARRVGSSRFLMLAAASALGGAGLHYLLHSSDPALMIGASGAVSGVMAATARFAFGPGGPLAGGSGPAAYLRPAAPVLEVLANPRALAFIAIWFAVNLLFGLAGGLAPGASGPIAWEAHIGGFVVGFLLFAIFDPIRAESVPGDRLTP